MKEGRKIEPEKIHLVRIQTIKGNIDSSPNAAAIKVEKHDFNFEVAIGVKAEEKVIGIVLTVNIQALDSNNIELDLKASFTHELVFEIDNLAEFVNVQEENPASIVDRLMLGALLGIAYSTVRGIIFTITQGTPLTGVTLPVIDPKNFISEENPEKKKTPDEDK